MSADLYASNNYRLWGQNSELQAASVSDWNTVQAVTFFSSFLCWKILNTLCVWDPKIQANLPNVVSRVIAKMCLWLFYIWSNVIANLRIIYEVSFFRNYFLCYAGKWRLMLSFTIWKNTKITDEETSNSFSGPNKQVPFARVKTTDMLWYEYLSNHKQLSQQSGMSLANFSELWKLERKSYRETGWR